MVFRLIAPAVALMATVALTLPALAQATQPASGGGMTFDFEDPKGVNAVSFMLISEIEPIVGMGSGISGEVDYDPTDPASIRGSISLSAEGLQCSNPSMTQAMRGADWLGVSDHPLVTFEFVSAEVMQQEGDAAVLRVTGELTLAGQTQEMPLMLQVTHLPGMADDRGGAESGDLLKLETVLDVDRADFGIKPDMDGQKVAETVRVIIPIIGYSK